MIDVDKDFSFFIASHQPIKHFFLSDCHFLCADLSVFHVSVVT